MTVVFPVLKSVILIFPAGPNIHYISVSVIKRNI